MEFENEKKTEELSAEQQNQNHESGYQGYRPGRSPRPRIQKPRPQFNQGSYNRNQEQEGDTFRPEGFGAGLMSGGQQRSQGEYGQSRGGYRPRNNYNSEGGYQPRQQYGQPRQGGYQQRQGGYQQRPQGGYNQRPQQGEYGQQRPQYGQPR